MWHLPILVKRVLGRKVGWQCHVLCVGQVPVRWRIGLGFAQWMSVVTSRRTASEGRWKHKLDWDGIRVRRWREVGRSEESSLLRSWAITRNENSAPVGEKGWGQDRVAFLFSSEDGRDTNLLIHWREGPSGERTLITREKKVRLAGVTSLSRLEQTGENTQTEGLAWSRNIDHELLFTREKIKYMNITTGGWVEVAVRVLFQLLLLASEIWRKQGHQMIRMGRSCFRIEKSREGTK